MITCSPLVSIIIAVYNGAQYLEGCIRSVLEQDYKNYEIIIIDGKSSDGTAKIITKYHKFIRYTVSEKDKGIYDAWNKGVKAASGDWIAFIGADDLLYPHAIQSYVNYICQNPSKDDLEFVSSKIEIVDDKMSLLRTVGEPWDWQLFKEKMVTWHVGTFHSKKLFIKYGLFDDTYKVSGDYEFLLRPKASLKAAYFPIVTARMRDGGVSAKLLYKAIDETYRAKVKNGILSPWIGPILMYNNKCKLFIKTRLVKFGLIKENNSY